MEKKTYSNASQTLNTLRDRKQMHQTLSPLTFSLSRSLQPGQQIRVKSAKVNISIFWWLRKNLGPLLPKLLTTCCLTWSSRETDDLSFIKVLAGDRAFCQVNKILTSLDAEDLLSLELVEWKWKCWINKALQKDSESQTLILYYQYFYLVILSCLGNKCQSEK